MYSPERDDAAFNVSSDILLVISVMFDARRLLTGNHSLINQMIDCESRGLVGQLIKHETAIRACHDVATF